MLRLREPKQVEPVETTGSSDPSPTTIDEGVDVVGGRERERVPVSDVIWEEAPESMYQSVVGGAARVIVLNALANAC